MFLETVYVVLANMQQKILCKLQKKKIWHLTNLNALLIIALQGEFVVGSIVDIEIINQCFILFQIGFDQFVAFDNHFPGGMAPGDFFPQFGTAAGNIEIAEDKVHFGCVASVRYADCLRRCVPARYRPFFQPRGAALHNR